MRHVRKVVGGSVVVVALAVGIPELLERKVSTDFGNPFPEFAFSRPYNNTFAIGPVDCYPSTLR